MGELQDAIGNKAAGQLIRSEDWNRLVIAVDTLQSTVERLSTSVEQRLGDLTTRLDATDGRLDAIAGTVQALADRLFRVTLRTERTSYALGEIAEITAQLTDLEGNPLALPDPASRPWIDFLTVWGHFKPVGGFQSRGGAEDRTLSVQVDQDGVARVRLRADHAEAFDDDEDDEIVAALGTIVAQSANRTVAQAILAAETPLQARTNGAFSLLSTEYDRADAQSLRRFTDIYYANNPLLVAGTFTSRFRHRWRDYRTSVIAVAKSDADPTTADPSLGSCSIQLTFRDWISPWIHLDYLPGNVQLIPEYRDRLGAGLGADYRIAFDRWSGEIDEILGGKGLIAQQRDFEAISQAARQLQVADPPEYLPNLVQSVQGGLQLQRLIGPAAGGSLLGDTGPGTGFRLVGGLDTRLLDAAVRAEDAAVAQAGEAIGRSNQLLERTSQELRDETARARRELEADLATEQQRLRDVIEAADGPVQQVRQSLDTVRGNLVTLSRTVEKKADIDLLGRFLNG